MANYTFAPQAAVDIATAELASGPGLSGQMYASEADAQAQTSPLTVTVAGGVTATEIGVSTFGQLPEITVADHWQVWWRSGDVIVHMISFDGLLEAAQTAATSAAVAVSTTTAMSDSVASLSRWVDLGVTRRNMATDPRLALATMFLNGAVATDTRPATGAPDGRSYFRRSIGTANTASPMWIPVSGSGLSGMPVVAGQSYVVSWHARKSLTGGPSSRADWTWYDAAGAQISQNAGAAKSANASWQRFEQVNVAPAGAIYGQVRLSWSGTGVVGQDLDLAMVLVESGTVASAYFDGSTPSTTYVGTRWVGDPNASYSELIDMSTLVRTVNGMPGPDVTVAAGGGGGTTDHNALSNLTVGDPHTQYLTLARALAQFWTRAQVDAMVTAAATQESAQDRARSNHTGTQGIGTVVGLQAALDAAAANAGGPTVVHFTVATTDTTPRPANAGMVLWLDARADKTSPPTNMGDNDRWSPSAAVPSGDLTGPSTPTTLTKTSITASSFTLGWAASTDNVGVTGYDVQRDGATSYGFQAGTSRSITGLSPSTTYVFRVRARDAAGNTSPWSDPITVDTIASSDSVPPTVPTGLASTGLTASGFTVTWGAGTDNVGVTGYDVRIGGGSPETVAASPRSKTFSGLAELTAYTVEIRTRDGAGLTSAWVPISVTTLEGSGETYSVYGAGAPTGTWSLASDGGPYIVFGRGFVCSAAGARVVGGRAWIPTGAGGAKPTEATFYLFGPNAGLGSTAVQTKVVSTAGAAEGSWVEAMFDVPEDIETGEVWMIGVRYTGAGDAGKYVYAPNTRPNGDPIISTGDLAEELAWSAYGSGFSTQYKIGTGSATVPGSYDQSYGVDILVDLGGA